MRLQTELQAYSAKINLPLLDSIVAFVLDTAEATHAQRAGLRRQCPFLSMSASGSAFQEKYGFLYLGELLERYKERFGMTVQDLRAIALALAYTRELTTPEMFVGPQRDDFLRKIRKSAGGDIYLSGALYLLDEGKDGATDRELKLTGADFDSTEDLLFVLGLFHDWEQAFPHFKPQLLRLLGRERTMPVLGNTTALNWLIAWLAPQLKSTKGKDIALFRALCALPTSYVKADGKPHGVLLEHGYASLEIAYANMMSVLAQPVDGTLRTDSIVSEKIAVALFHEALYSDTPFTPDVYEQLSTVYRLYERFSIRCYGHERLLQALEPDTRIRNADTFLWFSTMADIYSPVFSSFDVMDSRWDALAGTLTPKQYRPLFEACLDDGMAQEEIRSRLDRYRELTGSSYADCYWEHSYGNRFGLLVNKGILDLWSLFRNSLGEDGRIDKPEMVANIWGYVRSIRTPQAFQFFEQFFSAYDVEGLERFFGYHHRDFPDALIKRQHYSNDPIILDLHRDYLDGDGHRLLLRWLEMFIFTYQPEKYMDLITAILRDEAVAGLFSAGEQRELFDLIAKQPGRNQGILGELKRHYLTEDELRAERDAEAAARRVSELRQREEMVQGIRGRYRELLPSAMCLTLPTRCAARTVVTQCPGNTGRNASTPSRFGWPRASA
ncbi:MAG: hypothetical protein K2N78_02040 [Oscillospiraceae bacterium]|nr:hypothetical protein [Oscillospiraceae bacterium]